VAEDDAAADLTPQSPSNRENNPTALVVNSTNASPLIDTSNHSDTTTSSFLPAAKSGQGQNILSSTTTADTSLGREPSGPVKYGELVVLG